MSALPVLSNPIDMAPSDRPPRQRELDAIARDLANAVAGEVRFGLHDRMLYATDASLYQVEPLGVVVPASVEDAERAVRFCSERSLPILARGGGTSLAGQCTNRAVVIDFSVNCRAVGEVDVDRRRVGVEPGVTLDELNEELARRGTGLFFGPDVATSRHANLGGMIGNNSAGARSILYGRTVEHVLGLDVLALTPDGRVDALRLGRGESGHARLHPLREGVAEVVRRHAGLIRDRFPKTVRHVDGYNLDLMLAQLEGAGGHPREHGVSAGGAGGPDDLNLASLVCGSEGTLAVTLGATLNLVPTPRGKGLAVLGFAWLDDAMAALGPILETRPSAVELLDDMVIDLARANVEHRRYVELLPAPAGGGVKAVLYVEYFAIDDRAEIAQRFATLRRLLPDAPTRTYDDPRAMEQAWKLRKAGEPLLHGVPGRRKPLTFVEDTAVDPSKLPAFVKDFRALVERRGTKAAFYAHASVGCLHIRPLLSMHDAADLELMQRIAEDVTDLVKAYGGALSGEHGDGRVRSPLLERYFGPELMAAFREIKALFDSRGLLNPANLVEPGPVASIVTRTRVNPAPTSGRMALAPEVDTYFDYADQHGFDGAVEMCNGAGVCRKKRGGTMCPSYMATLDERHSTRGRGNALRLAITGQLGGDGDGERRGAMWDDEETMRTLDLCLSCKACKTECPSNVDIARLKAEYTAQRHRSGGRPSLSTRILGGVRAVNALGSLTPGLANWVNGLPPARALINRVMGFAPRRSLPRFERSLYRWHERHATPADAASRPRVALFGDCFTAYSETSIGVAAFETLEALGYVVALPRTGCCARPKISLGMLDGAIAEADRTLHTLRELIEDDSVRAILVAEPSCLSAFKDDYLSLRLRAPIGLRLKLAAKAMLVEEFIDAAWRDHPVPAREPEPASAPPVLLHAHCHQKALWGAETSAGLLRRLVGDRLTVLDSGCCGMAGAFGFAARRFELSVRIGELSLLPAVRAAATGTIIAAAGTSCRHQVHDGAGVRALHPIEVAARLMAPPTVRRV